MAKYPKLHSTNKGRELVAESNVKKKAIEYTKAVIGDAQYNDSIDSLLAVVSPKMECAFSSAEVSASSQFTINFTIDNHNLENGFYAREIGIYARLEGTEDEILFAYTNGGNYVDYIPDKSTPVDAQMVEAIINIGDAENVTIVKNDGTFITWKDLNNHNTDPNAHGGILASVDTKISDATKPVLAQLNSGLDKLNAHDSNEDAHTPLLNKWINSTFDKFKTEVKKVVSEGLTEILDIQYKLDETGYVRMGFLGGFTIQWGYVFAGNSTANLIIKVKTVIPYDSDKYAISMGNYMRTNFWTVNSDHPSMVVNSTVSNNGFDVQVDDYTEGIWWVTFGKS